MHLHGGIIEDVTFADGADTGDVCAVMLSEEPVNAAAWTIDFYAETGEGVFFVGRQLTIAQAVRSAAGLPGNRIVASANAPGAKRWRLQVTTVGGVQQEAEIYISSSNKGSGGAFGVTPVSP